MFRLFAFLLLFPVAVGAQEPAFFVTVGSDTAWSSPWTQNRKVVFDTIRVSPTVGDTLKFAFYAQNWPLVYGYHFDVETRGYIRKPNRPLDNSAFITALGYVTGDFIKKSGLPTSEEGLLFLPSNNIQLGSVSLGDQTGEGGGHLGTLSVTIDTFHSSTAQLKFNGIALQLPQGSLVRDSIRASITVVISSNPAPEKITCDFNKNGIVDFSDFLVFASQFGRHKDRDLSYDDRIDLIEDGSVDFTDFLLFASHFGKPPVLIRLRSISG